MPTSDTHSRPHLNHRFTPEFSVTRPLWFDQYLKGSFQFPATRIPSFRSIQPPIRFHFKSRRSVQTNRRCSTFLFDGRRSRARFWRTATSTKQNGNWIASLPIVSKELPLFAYATSSTDLMKRSKRNRNAARTNRFGISSKLHTLTPMDLKESKVIESDPQLMSLMISPTAGKIGINSQRTILTTGNTRLAKLATQNGKANPIAYWLSI